jgi:hypothetical protein
MHCAHTLVSPRPLSLSNPPTRLLYPMRPSLLCARPPSQIESHRPSCPCLSRTAANTSLHAPISHTPHLLCCSVQTKQSSLSFTKWFTLPYGRHTLWLTTRTQPAASCTRKILLFATMSRHVSLAQTWGSPWRLFFGDTLGCDIRVCCGRADTRHKDPPPCTCLTDSIPSCSTAATLILSPLRPRHSRQERVCGLRREEGDAEQK